MDADTAWLLAWLAIALGAGIAEVLSLDLLFATVAGAALVTAGAAGAGASPGLQLVVFAASAVVLLVGVRPPLKRRLERSAPANLTGVAALVGRTAFVLSDVTERGGRVKLAGEVWSARADQPGAVLPRSPRSSWWPSTVPSRSVRPRLQPRAPPARLHRRSRPDPSALVHPRPLRSLPCHPDSSSPSSACSCCSC
ncbi:MAG: NfeD family protein [Kineosporiaceae bacterium]